MTPTIFAALLFAWASGANAGAALHERGRKHAVFAVLYLLCVALMVWRSMTQ